MAMMGLIRTERVVFQVGRLRLLRVADRAYDRVVATALTDPFTVPNDE